MRLVVYNNISADECKSAKGNLSVPVGLIRAVSGYMEAAGLTKYLNGFKKKGVGMGALVNMLLVYSLYEDSSMASCARWLEDDRVRRLFGIRDNVSQKTLNRALQILGDHREGTVVTLYNGIRKLFPDIGLDIDADGSSVSMNSEGGLAGYGYPRDGNPDGLQVEFMLGMYEDSHIPFYTMAFKGNVSDEEQYARTLPEMLSLVDQGNLEAYRAISDRLVAGIKARNSEKELAKASRGKARRGRKKKVEVPADPGHKYPLLEVNRALGNATWVIFDNGGASVYNTDAVNEMGHEYLTRKKMNKTDLTMVKRSKPVEVEPGLLCWSETFEKSGRTKYVFWSKDLDEARSEAAGRKVRRMKEVAQDLIAGRIDPGSLVEKKRNEFIDFDVKVSIQQILEDFSDKNLEKIKERYKGEYCGFFHLESSAQLTPLEAIRKYRKRVAIEHAIRALKNVAGIKPMRVWDDASVTGRIVLALLAQAVIAMARYEYPEDEVKVTKKGRSAVKGHRPDSKTVCRMLTQLTATFYTDEHKRICRVLCGVSDENIGIIERLEARTGRSTLEKHCFQDGSTVETG